jgi:hypothetical protein
MEPGGVLAMIIAALATTGAVVLVEGTRRHLAGVHLDRDIRRHPEPIRWQEPR